MPDDSTERTDVSAAAAQEADHAEAGRAAAGAEQPPGAEDAETVAVECEEAEAPVASDAAPCGRDDPVEKLARQHDQLLRLAAEFDNYRKRSRRQEAEAEDRGRGEALLAMLPVADNLDRALAHAEQATDPAAIVDGVRLVAKQFQDALEGQGVRRLDRAVGRAFDPSFHEAISQVETADAAPGTVAIELQAGYLCKDKLLRPALVIVARPPRKPAGAALEEAARPAAAAASEETGEA